MATSSVVNPEVVSFCKQVEKDDRVVHVWVQTHPIFTSAPYAVTVLFPNNWEVGFTVTKLAEARRYIKNNVAKWYDHARNHPMPPQDMRRSGSER